MRTIGEKLIAAHDLAINAAMDFLVQRVKDALSTPKPFWSKRTPAGRVPYMVTGNLRSSIHKKRIGNNVIVDTDVRSRGVPYGKILEAGNHTFIGPTAYKFRNEIAWIYSYVFADEMRKPY